jgi:hypothetical protein
MKDVPLAGSLGGLSVPRLLFSLAQSKRSGRLSIAGPGEPRPLYVDRGHLVLDSEAVPDRAFRDRLLAAGLLDNPALEACETQARVEGIPFLRTLFEKGGARPEAAWNLLEEEYKSRLFALFDESFIDYDFEAGQAPLEADILSLLPIPPLLLEGLRRMANEGLIRSSLPPATEIIQVLSLSVSEADRVVLAPHERYLLLAIGKGRSLEELRLQSRLGPRETDRTLFLLLCLGLAGRPVPKDPAWSGRELTPSEIERMMAAFRDKSTAIFKYISKELGPFARTVLGKALEEIKPALGPMFESIELLEDGTIEFKSPLKININLLTEDSQAELARGLTEILSAEVLAVKKSLGNDHEAALVKNLEKVGEWN